MTAGALRARKGLSAEPVPAVSGTDRVSRGLRGVPSLSGTAYLSDGDMRSYACPDWLARALKAVHPLVMGPGTYECLLRSLEADPELRAAVVSAWDLAPDGSHRGDEHTVTTGPHEGFRREAVRDLLRAQLPYLPDNAYHADRPRDRPQ